MNKTVTIKLNQNAYLNFINLYRKYEVPFNGEYIVFKALKDDTSLTVYENKKKDTYKVLFMGQSSLKLAKEIVPEASYNVPKKKIIEKWLDENTQIGSDEVGVGDLFLPMIVIATYVNKNDIEELKLLGVHDSKKLGDERIMELGPKLVKRFEFSKQTLSNTKYNEMIAKGENLNTLKAKMHNNALNNLKEKYSDVEHVYIDQFVEKTTYYKYIKSEKKIVDSIVFKTKGESFYPSIALASVIARYCFLLEKDKLEKKYKVTFPFGSSKSADEFAHKFIKKFGLAEFSNLVKQNFKNYKELVEKTSKLF
jgi:ribonuclease HIII